LVALSCSVLLASTSAWSARKRLREEARALSEYSKAEALYEEEERRGVMERRGVLEQKLEGGGAKGGAGALPTMSKEVVDDDNNNSQFRGILPRDLLASTKDITGYAVDFLPGDVLASLEPPPLQSKPSPSSSSSSVPSLPALPVHENRRTYKSYAVGKAVAASLNRILDGKKPTPSSSSSSSSSSPPQPLHPAFVHPLAAYMKAAGKFGGYSGAPLPLQHPSAYKYTDHPNPPLPLLSSISTAFTTLPSIPVLSFLRTAIVQGCLLLRTPDGTEHCFGDPSAAAPLRGRIRVYSWGFFMRVAAESDLGLARSFIAGDWGADDLTAVFNVFIANRDGAAALSTHGLWTAWIGLTLNFLTYALRMDNSVANSRSNIHAHYDLSNDLFSAFLDPGTMMYSCGFFDTQRRVLREVDLHTGDSKNGGPSTPRLTLPQTSAALLNSIPRRPRDSAEGAKEHVQVMFQGTLEEAQLRKLDHLIARAQVQKG